jgi:hypothetical protein
MKPAVVTHDNEASLCEMIEKHEFYQSNLLSKYNNVFPSVFEVMLNMLVYININIV